MPKTSGAGRMSYLWGRLKAAVRGILLGAPLATSVQLEHRLPIILALPVFASDALSSVAYATEEILIQFEHAHLTPAAFTQHYLLWISLAIVLLMVIVGTSYRQAIHLYPSGGGSYSVSRDNLGIVAGLVAASALTIDYVLTVAVSISAGVAALVSAVQILEPYRVYLAIVLVLIIALINLRGTRESGFAFAIFAYSFILLLGAMVIVTIFRLATGTITPLHEIEHISTTGGASAVGLFLILRAFSSGCSALTGVEAVSNGVSAFQPPEAKNAAKTLLILISMLVVLFMGVSYAAYLYHAVPSATETIVSQVARASFGGRNVIYFATSIATLSVLMIAANTSFAGFPRLMAIVAKDGYVPKTFVTLGDRLVYNRGIFVLTGISLVLIWYFRADVNRLIGLYAVGVFICFTLSQLGMVRKVLELRENGWQRMIVVNIVGALVTGAATIVTAVTKFEQGAWLVVVLLPVMVLISYIIHRHYLWFEKTMTVHPDDYNPLAEPPEPLTVLVLVSSDIHRGILEGLECGRAIAEGHANSVLRAVHIEMDPEKTPRLKAKWAQMVEPYLGHKIRLDIVPSPYRWLIEPVLDYLDHTDLERAGDRIILVLPEFETGSIMTHFLHNFTGRRLRTVLLNRPHVTVVSSRYFMKPLAWRLGRGGLVY